MPSWGNLDINTDAFTKENMLIPYEGGISRQFLQKVASNTSFNNRLAGRSVFIGNESIAALASKVFDTDRDYRNSYVFWLGNANTDSGKFSLPYTETDISYVRPSWIQVVTSFQPISSGSIIRIKALASGGFELENTHPSSTYYVNGLLIEMRLTIGA